MTRFNLMKTLKIICQFIGSYLAVKSGFIYAINIIGRLASNPSYTVSGSNYVSVAAAVIIFIELVTLWINKRRLNIVTITLSLVTIPLVIFIDLSLIPTGSDYEAPTVIWLSVLIWIINFINSRLRPHTGVTHR